jgi:integrase
MSDDARVEGQTRVEGELCRLKFTARKGGFSPRRATCWLGSIAIENAEKTPRSTIRPSLERRAIGTNIVSMDLRHTWATLALEAGADVAVVSKRLGHSSPVITWNTYQPVRQGVQTDAAEERSGERTRTPKTRTKTWRVADYTTPERSSDPTG